MSVIGYKAIGDHGDNVKCRVCTLSGATTKLQSIVPMQK
jgi:hypothetical protein